MHRVFVLWTIYMTNARRSKRHPCPLLLAKEVPLAVESSGENAHLDSFLNSIYKWIVPAIKIVVKLIQVQTYVEGMRWSNAFQRPSRYGSDG